MDNHGGQTQFHSVLPLCFSDCLASNALWTTMVVKHSFTVFAMLVLFLLIHFLNISLSLAVKPSFDASQSERNRWKLHEICYRSEGGLQAHHDAPQGRTAALEDGRGNPRFDLGSCQADYCLEMMSRICCGSLAATRASSRRCAAAWRGTR